MAREIEYGLNSVGNFRLLGFATGAYSCTCRVCYNEFTGDKRAVMCLGCAIKAAEEKFAVPNKPIAQVCDWCGKGGKLITKHYHAGCHEAILNGEGAI